MIGWPGYSTDRTQPNTKVNPNWALGLLSGFTWGLLRVTFWKFVSTWGLLCVHLGFTLGQVGVYFHFTQFAFGVLFKHWNVMQTHILFNYLTACNSHSFYIQNTHVASASWVYFWLKFTLCMCLLWVYSEFTWGFISVHSSGPRVKP